MILLLLFHALDIHSICLLLSVYVSQEVHLFLMLDVNLGLLHVHQRPLHVPMILVPAV